MDISKTTIGVDVWEGQLDINEAEMLGSGVEYIFIRINDMNGGHHKDANFDKQWAEAINFIRAPYAVYNPWVSGSQNYSYFRSILPAGVTTVALDVEVKYSGYSADEYSKQVKGCTDIMRAAGLKPVIYSGAWFKPYLLTWPAFIDYWWARYPTALYPDTTQVISWGELKNKLAGVTWWPAAAGVIPGPCRLWQCTADRYILPGSSRVIDINVFNGTVQEMIGYYGFSDVQIPARLKPEPPPPPVIVPTVEERLAALETKMAAVWGILDPEHTIYIPK
jgi:GH25 family lysozyme M1 (1,4-beta-N-acetylmuramidase)